MPSLPIGCGSSAGSAASVGSPELSSSDNKIPGIFLRHKNTMCWSLQGEKLHGVLSLLRADLRAGRRGLIGVNVTGWVHAAVGSGVPGGEMLF